MDLSRRELLVLGVAAACSCAVGEGLAFAVPPTPGKTDAGPLGDYTSDRINDAFTANGGFFVISSGGKIHASSAVCTHKKNALKLKDGAIVCPAHKSQFDTQGTVTKGPAKKSLERFAVAIDEKQHVIVDTSTSFDEPDWNKPGAFVSLK